MHTSLKLMCIFAIASKTIICLLLWQILSFTSVYTYNKPRLVNPYLPKAYNVGLATTKRGGFISLVNFLSMQDRVKDLQGKKYSNAGANAKHSDIVHLIQNTLTVQGSRSINEDLNTLLHAFITHPDFKEYTPKSVSDLLFTIQTVTTFFFDAELKINAHNG